MRRVLLAAAAVFAWIVKQAPGVAAVTCATVGVYLVTGGVGWALLTAVPFMLALDFSMRSPRR